MASLQRDVQSESMSQVGTPSPDPQSVHRHPEQVIPDGNSTTQGDNRQAPKLSSSPPEDPGALSSSHSFGRQSPSAARHRSPPVGVINSELEELRRLQEAIPSKPKFIRLPIPTDFPSSINLEVVNPVTNDQIEFAIVILEIGERKLEWLARILQQKYPENAYILVRPEQGETLHGWADPQDDQNFIATSRMLLLKIIQEGLINKCGFKTEQIVILGYGQGGTAALSAVSLWESIEFAGVVSIGGAVPARSNPKAPTPTLLLRSIPQKGTPMPQGSHDVSTDASDLIRVDVKEFALEAPDQSKIPLGPIVEFFAHRLRREEWTKQAIISFDGGGIRGYGSLLIVRELMNKIGDEEKRYDLETHSSFFPCSFKPTRAKMEKTSSVPIPLRQSPRRPESSRSNIITASPLENLPNSSLFYPCHYFTYAAGTSTGGLISIMLSRLRMSVDECIEEYKTLGEKVFAHPRPLCKGGFPWPKYDHKVLEKVIRSVTARYDKKSDFEAVFPLDEDLCRTIVLAYGNAPNKTQVPYVFRTYRAHPQRLDPGKSKANQRKARNPGPAPEIPIWQVARATSAAPGYFAPVRIRSKGSEDEDEYTLFKDGGFGANNPSKEALRSVVEKHGGSVRKIDAFVSIGTGAHSVPIFAKKPGKWRDLKANVKGALGHPGRTAGYHEDMADISERDGFPYYRFEGGEHLGKIALDEWKSTRIAAVRGKNSTPGYKTIDAMDQATSVYLLLPNVQADLKELARILVKRRRLRAKDNSSWDRYASASYFECPLQGCERDRIMTSRAYEEHLRVKHGKTMTAEDLESDMKTSRRCWLYDNGKVPESKLTGSAKGKAKASLPPTEMTVDTSNTG